MGFFLGICDTPYGIDFKNSRRLILFKADLEVTAIFIWSIVSPFDGFPVAFCLSDFPISLKLHFSLRSSSIFVLLLLLIVSSLGGDSLE